MTDPQQPVSPALSTPLMRLWRLVRALWRRVENLVFALVLLLIILYFILQMPVVQNWLVGKATNYLSEELHTTVRIQHLDFEFFDKLVLDGFYVQDLQGDTLLYTEQLTAGLSANIFSLLENRLEFDEVSLNKARFNIRRAAGDKNNSLQFILDYFSNPQADNRPKKPFKIRFQARNVHLRDVEFIQDDQVRGQKTRLAIGEGNIQLNNFDLVANVVDIRSVELVGFVFNLAQYPGQALPIVPVVQPVQSPLDSLAAGTLGKNQPRPVLHFTMGSFSLTEGVFSMDRYQISPARSTADGVMDFNHLLVQNISFQAENIDSGDDLIFQGKLLNLTAREQSGFLLAHGQADRVIVCDTLTALYGAKIQTPQSTLGDTIAFNYQTYRDYRKFNNQVRMDIRLAPGSHLRLGDIAYFSGAISRNTFFISNRETVADISGVVNGTVNNLNGRNLDIHLGNRAFLHGNFDGDDLTKGEDLRRMTFDFKQLQSDIQTIRNIIPGFNAPQYFDRLGNISFSGTYQVLFTYNHLLAGRLHSDIGSGNVDMELDLTGGREKATYSGGLNLHNFDLGSWTGNAYFGKTTFNIHIAEGSTGLTVSTLRTKFQGKIDTLSYRGYNYKNVRLDGAFKQKVFDGTVASTDPNADFVFDGSINLRDTTPVFVFKTDIRRLDLGKLNLVSKDWVLSGKVEQLRIAADNWADLTGTATLRNFLLIENKDVRHQIDSLRFTSFLRPDGSRYFEVLSDVMDAYMEGNFNLRQTPRSLLQLLSRNHPEFAARLRLPISDSLNNNDNFAVHIDIKNTRDLTHLFAPGLDTLVNIKADGRIDASQGSIKLVVNIPQIKYNNIQVRNIAFNWEGQDNDAQYNLIIPQSSIGKTRLAPIRLQGLFKRNELTFKLTARDSNTIVRGINLDGVLTTLDSLWQIKFNASDIALFNEQWVMSEDNYIRFGKGFFATQEFEFFHDNQRIRLDSMNNGRGLSLSLTNFDLNFLNRFTTGRNMSFRGKIYDFDVTVDEIFQLQGIKTYITTDTVFINEVPYGEITGNLEMADKAAPLAWTLFLNQNRQQVLRVVGGWLPGGDKPVRIESADVTVPPGEFRTSVKAANFPLNILQTFVPGISKIAGQFRAGVVLSGPFNAIDMDGSAVIETGQFQLDYLKTMYHIRNQKIDLSKGKIYATGDTIYDASQRHAAVIRGGLLHKQFKAWRLDCYIRSLDDNFMILNTSADDNQLYYGQAIGRFEANFTGTFAQTNISIIATTGKETRLYIPISTAIDAQEVRFIKFKSKQDSIVPVDKAKSFSLSDIKGLDFEMSVTITDDAEVQLIFDEQAGDIIKGRGDGDLRLVLTRDGAFRMYGNYTIQRGEYLFTLLNWVNKPFTVQQGGVVQWSGDPYAAQINLDATYADNTSLYNFISDELELLRGTQPELITEASKATQVIVTMHLKGDLMKPNISFDLEFPNLPVQVRTIAENKLRLLRQDQNELNRQVFGLVVVGSFLPSSSAAGTGVYLASAFNTLTQVLSNQFSSYLSGLASEIFGSKLSSIDFDVAYNEYQNSLNDAAGQLNNQTGRELQLRLTSGLFNDRITVQFGSQFGLGSPGATANDGFLGEDAVVEIQLTENRRWQLKVYQRTEPDIGGSQLRSRYGFGISYRRDYDSFSELMKGLGIWWKKKEG